MCTGSGCLAILAALRWPKAGVDGADISPDALEVARRNVADYRLEGRVNLVRSDMFGALAGRTYDLIVSNPPYVNADSMAKLPPEYLREPQIALRHGEALTAEILATNHVPEAKAHVVAAIGEARHAAGHQGVGRALAPEAQVGTGSFIERLA